MLNDCWYLQGEAYSRYLVLRWGLFAIWSFVGMFQSVQTNVLDLHCMHTNVTRHLLRSVGPGLYRATGGSLPHSFRQPYAIAVGDLQCARLGTCTTSPIWALCDFFQVS